MRTTIALTLALLAAILSAWYLVYTGREEVALAESRTEAAVQALHESEARSKRVADMLVARERKIASQARISAQAQAAVSEALNSIAVFKDRHGVLQRNKSWSDTDVPPDVQEALTGRSGGLGGDSGGVLSDHSTTTPP